MDFFKAQEDAKKRTQLAIVLFFVAVVLTVVAVYSALSGVILHMGGRYYSSEGIDPFSWLFPVFWQPARALWCGVITLGTILIASLWRLGEISKGGAWAVEAMGGRIIEPSTTNEKERRLLNVVEEMAIASGYAIPQVAILDNEININAFAAALTPRDAVVCVTAGALESFNREELQAVIGHEFSHLLNGDSQLNLTLHGWVYGLFALTTIGWQIIRLFGRSRSSSRSNKKGGGALVPIFIFALALIVIGFIAHLIGKIIQALISRQREFLADASAVQFTRNPEAMVKALGRIKHKRSALEHPNAEGLAHCFFSTSSRWMEGLGAAIDSHFATHPPLSARMAAIMPNYQSVIENLSEPIRTEATEPPAPVAAPVGLGMGFTGMIAAAGTVAAAQTTAATAFKANLAGPIANALQTDSGATAILLGLALSSDATARAQQIKTLTQGLSPEVADELAAAHDALATLPHAQHIPIAQLALAHTRKLTGPDRDSIATAIETLAAADGKLSAFEAFYLEYVRHGLALPALHPILKPTEAAGRLLSRMLSEQKMGAENFETIVEGLALPPLSFQANVSTASLREALPSLMQFSYLQRRELLIASGRAVKADGEVSDDEAESLRCLAGIMDIPMPSRL